MDSTPVAKNAVITGAEKTITAMPAAILKSNERQKRRRAQFSRINYSSQSEFFYVCLEDCDNLRKTRIILFAPIPPELNPDELVWNDLKNNTVGRSRVTEKAEFRELVVQNMKKLKTQPQKIASFFRKDNSLYAA